MFTKSYMGAELTKRCVSFGQRVKRFQSDITKMCAATLYEVLEHGDVDLLNTRLTGIIEGAKGTIVRRNALIAWFEAYGPVVWNDTTKKLVYSKPKRKAIAADVEDNLAYALKSMETPPHEFAPEQEYKPFNFEEQLNKLVERAVRQQKKENKKDNFDGLFEAKKFLTTMKQKELVEEVTGASAS